MIKKYDFGHISQPILQVNLWNRQLSQKKKNTS